MLVLKRNGSKQPFDAEKIQLTIARASDEINQPMTSGDLRRIAQQVEEELRQSNTEMVSYDLVHARVVRVLNDTGFPEISRRYDESELSRVGKAATQ